MWKSLGRIVIWTAIGGKGFSLAPVLLTGAIVGAGLVGFGYLVGKNKAKLQESEDDEEKSQDSEF